MAKICVIGNKVWVDLVRSRLVPAGHEIVELDKADLILFGMTSLRSFKKRVPEHLRGRTIVLWTPASAGKGFFQAGAFDFEAKPVYKEGLLLLVAETLANSKFPKVK